MTVPVPQRARSTWPICALLLALTAVAYAPVRHFGYVPFDDPVLIRDEPHVHAGLTRGAVRWAVTSLDFGPWMPLQRLSLLADQQWFGLDTGTMHVENVALHGAAVVFLFLFLTEATGAVARSAVAAALFAVHPIHVESVAWLSERRDVQCLALFNASLWAYARYARTHRWTAYVTSVALFAIAAIAKATVMTAPPLLLLLDAWPLRRLPARGDRPAWRRLILEKLPFAAVALPVAAIAAHGQRLAGAAVSLAAEPLADRVANVLVTTPIYLWKLVAPTDLAVLYLPPPGGWSPGRTAIAAAGLAVLFGAALWYRRRLPYLLVGLAWFFIANLPTSGLTQAGYQSMADRYAYLPSIGLTAAAAWAVADLATVAVRGATLRRRSLVGGAVVVIAIFTAICRRQAGYWRDGRTLYTRAVAVTGANFVTEYQLGLCDAADHDYASAAARFANAIRFNPDQPDPWIDLGTCVSLHDPRGAIPLYEHALALRPNPASAARAYANLGNAYLVAGRPADAVAALTRALRIDPTSDYARRRLADATRAAGQAKHN